jgi:transposase
VYYVGLDVHPSRTSVEILDCNGKLFKRTEVKGRWPLLIEELRKIPGPFAVCYEASCGYGHLYEQLAPLAQQIKVAHPSALKWIFKSKKKHNRIDASKVAKVLYLDEVPAVHVPPAATRNWRQTIEFRQKLLRSRVMAKNQVRAFLRERGLVAPMNLWTVKGRQWLKDLTLDEGEALRRDLLADELEESEKKLKRVDKYLNQIAAKNAGVGVLRTIPGIGPRTAEALVAYIDDVRRFGSVKHAGSYFGLVPCQDASADKNRLGHITRDGPGTVRKLLCEAAWTAVRCSPEIRSRFDRLVGRDPDRKKIAIVAIAHYLVRVAVSMLKSGECWRGQAKPQPPTAEVPGGGGGSPTRAPPV